MHLTLSRNGGSTDQGIAPKVDNPTHRVSYRDIRCKLIHTTGIVAAVDVAVLYIYHTETVLAYTLLCCYCDGIALVPSMPLSLCDASRVCCANTLYFVRPLLSNSTSHTLRL